MKILLDEHLSPKLVEIVRSLAPALNIESIHHWQNGRFVNRPDEQILLAAAEDARVLVTFDVRTIPAILVQFGIDNQRHGGVVFVSTKSFPQNNFKGLAHAIAHLAERSASDRWANRVAFLTKE